MANSVTVPNTWDQIGAGSKFDADSHALAQSDYLVGNSFTLADAAAIPYVNRADMLGLAGLWENRRPRVADWYARMRQRPTFNSAITAYWDDDARQRFDVPRDEVWAECMKILPSY
jgi:glutathione S-transferase